MLGSPDPKKLEKMMKKFNMNVRHVPADRVVITSSEKDIVINDPEVMIVNMMGRDVYQISGNVSERTPVRDEDVQTVMEKTGKDRETVVRKLEELDNDLARAIMELKKK